MRGMRVTFLSRKKSNQKKAKQKNFLRSHILCEKFKLSPIYKTAAGTRFCPCGVSVSTKKEPRRLWEADGMRGAGATPLLRFLASVLCRIAKNAVTFFEKKVTGETSNYWVYTLPYCKEFEKSFFKNLYRCSHKLRAGGASPSPTSRFAQTTWQRTNPCHKVFFASHFTFSSKSRPIFGVNQGIFANLVDKE